MAVSRESYATALVVAAAAIVAVASARPFAGSWNDGSRLATVESLVDHGTLVIDDSIFVRVPSADNFESRTPYRGPALDNGTLDKLYIQGHFYSDKSPVPALLLAAVYQILQWLIGLRARIDPAAFCWWMTVLSSGTAYVLATVCVFKFGKLVQLSLQWRLLVTASFGLGSVAVVYVQHVNNHIMLLGVAAALMLVAGRMVLLPGSSGIGRLLILGTLAGLGYTIDLGAGPVLLVATAGLVGWQYGLRLAPLALFAIGALPWLALHHAVNYAVGGTIGPANAVPEYFQWPGCPFQGAALTGSWHHANIIDFAVYALGLLIGKRGFFGHNLALFVLIVGIWTMRRRIFDFRFSIFDWRNQTIGAIENQKSKIKNGVWVLSVYFLIWCLGTWLLYAATSRNYSGANCSIRWFVPMLAPAYCGLCVLLSRCPQFRAGFLVMSVWGIVLMAIAWQDGPWIVHMVPGFWFVNAGAFASWAFVAWRKRALRKSTATSADLKFPVITRKRLISWFAPQSTRPAVPEPLVTESPQLRHTR